MDLQAAPINSKGRRRHTYLHLIFPSYLWLHIYYMYKEAHDWPFRKCVPVCKKAQQAKMVSEFCRAKSEYKKNIVILQRE